MFIISVTFDKKKMRDNNYRDISNNLCIQFTMDDDFLIITDIVGVTHWYKKDYIVAFHTEVKHEE